MPIAYLNNFFTFFKNFWATYSFFVNFMRVRGIKRFFIGLASDGLTVSFAGLILFFMVGQYALVDVGKGWQFHKKYSVTFYDNNNQKIGRRGIKRDNAVPLNELPNYMIMATLAVEDRKFYDHLGVDPLSIARALNRNIQASNRRVHGASTITQQLAKNLFFTPEVTIERKIKEAYMAFWLETNLTKNQILSLYFDRMYMGAGTYGLEAASQYYFKKSVRDVNLAEAAMLAGLFKAPSGYAPHVNLKAAQNRANIVLTSLVDANFMTEAQVSFARKNPAKVAKRTEREIKGEYFIGWAYKNAKKLADGKSYILHVKTTMDTKLQADARKSIQNSLNENGEKYKVKQASLVSMEYDGAVLALIGGKDYRTSQFNRATTSMRQPGSSFKPLVYMAALNSGLTPDSFVVDSKVRIKKWSPKNYNRRYIGQTTLNNALVKSINTIPVKLAQQVGYNNVIATAKSLGIDANLRPNPSLPLGTDAVSVLDLTGAFTTIANGGTLAQPYGITEIRDGTGALIYKRSRDEYAPRVVANPYKVSELKYMLGNVVEFGTGRRARLDFTKAYGKTGTTQGYRDAWFLGFTDHIVTGIWFGNDDYSKTKKLTGGRLPAMTFKNFMTAAYVSKFNLNLKDKSYQAVANIATPYNALYTAPQIAEVKKPTKTIKKISRRVNVISVSSITKKSFNNKRKNTGVTLNGKKIEPKARVKEPIRRPKNQSAYIDASGRIVILKN